MAPSKRQQVSVTWTWARRKYRPKWAGVHLLQIADKSRKFPYRTRIASLSSICRNIDLQPSMPSLSPSKSTKTVDKRRLMSKIISFRESMQRGRSLKDSSLMTKSETSKRSLSIFLQKRLSWRISSDKLSCSLGRGNRAQTKYLRKSNSSQCSNQMLNLRVAWKAREIRIKKTCRYRNRSPSWWVPMWMCNRTILTYIAWGN